MGSYPRNNGAGVFPPTWSNSAPPLVTPNQNELFSFSSSAPPLVTTPNAPFFSSSSAPPFVTPIPNAPFSSSSSAPEQPVANSVSKTTAPIQTEGDDLYSTTKFFTQDATKLIFTINPIHPWIKECFLDKRDAKNKSYSLDTLLGEMKGDVDRHTYIIDNTEIPKAGPDPAKNRDNFIEKLTNAYTDVMINDNNKYILLTLLSYNTLFAGAQLVTTYKNSIKPPKSTIQYRSELYGGLPQFNINKTDEKYTIVIRAAYVIKENRQQSIIGDEYVRTKWSIDLNFTTDSMSGSATFTIDPVPKDIDFLDIATSLSTSRTARNIERIKQDLVHKWVHNDTIRDKKTFKAQLAANSKNQANAKRKSNNATRKRSNSITKLAEKPLGFLKSTRFGFNTPDRARYRKLIPAVKLELEKLFEDNYNEVDRALNTQCMTDFFIHYIQELEKAGIAPGEPAAIAYYLTNGCNKSLLEVIDKSISLLLKELKDLITATKAPRPVNIPTSVNSKYSIANKLIARLIIFLDIYRKQEKDDGINELLSIFLKELDPIRDSDKLSSLRIPMTNLITALSDIRGVSLSLRLKTQSNRGKNSPICDIEAKIAPMVNAKYNQVWEHWLNRYIRYADPKAADKTHMPLTLSRMALSDKINILFFKIYLEYERLVQLAKPVLLKNSSLGACISPKDIFLQIERANSIRKGKYEDLEHFIKEIFLKIYRQIFMIQYIKTGSPEISEEQINTILSSIRVPPIREVSNRFYVPRTGNGRKNSNYAFPNLVSILYALENAPEIHPTEFELLSDEEFKGLLERIPSFSVSELYGLIQSIESKTNYNTQSRGYKRIQAILKKANEARSQSASLPNLPFPTEQDFITPELNVQFVPTPPNKLRSVTPQPPPNKPGSAVPQPPPNKPGSASIGGFRYSTQKKQNKKHRKTRRSVLRILAN